ncbi:hypothetical protein RP20_CCG012070 [Aedes albopictus]|nr:hypothetical protein RP20_CCG012070 [Aedes albopictus]
MKIILFLLCAALSGTWAIDSIQGRITGGSDAGPNEFPFTAAILISGDEAHTFCAGILVTPRHVLTSANCVIRQTMLTVMLGSSDITRMNQFIPVTNVRIHWNHSTTVISRGDLAILTLARNANLGENVAVAQLPRWSDVGNTFNGFGATLVGWGLSGHREDESIPLQHLQVVRNPIISNFACGLSHRFLQDEHICSSGDNGGPCDGDEGGPVMITEDGEPTVIAIHSFHFDGIGGCGRGRSSVHTRLTDHLDWLVEHTVLNIPIHIIIHPNYSSFFNRDDIAIVQLSRPAVLGDYVQVARLPRRYHATFTFTGWNSTIAGWGSSGNRDNEPLPQQHLHFAHGEVISNFVCGLSHSFVREGHICTATDEGGPCDGDEGSPIYAQVDGQTLLIAVHSFHYSGIRGCDRGRSAVNTRVTEYLDWIGQNTDVEILN